MYNNQQPGTTHPSIAPQSDGRRLVFPLSQWSGTFKTDNFMPSIVDYRCSLDDIHLFFNDIYYATQRLKPIRLANRLILWSFIMYVLCFVFGIMIEVDNQDSMFYYEAEGENIYQNPEEDNTGLFMILGGMFMLIFINIWALVYRNYAKVQLFRQMVNAMERHKYSFLQKGLRWAIPENCMWLELWMDYRYFSPYHLQPHSPALTAQGNNFQAIANTQNVPVSQKCTGNVNNGNNQNGQQLQQSYPVFELPIVQPGQIAADNGDANVNRAGMGVQGVGYAQGLPQYHPGQQQLGYGYGFYQTPQLNETLLGYQVPVQESENLRMMRPY